MKTHKPSTYLEREVMLTLDGIEWPCTLDIGISRCAIWFDAGPTVWLIDVQVPDCTAEQHRRLWDLAHEWVDEHWNKLLEAAAI